MATDSLSKGELLKKHSSLLEEYRAFIKTTEDYEKAASEAEEDRMEINEFNEKFPYSWHEICYESLAVGWFIGKGVSHAEAHLLAMYL